MTDFSKYRSDFPALQKEINGNPIAYLDSGASAQKPQQVIDAMSHVMQDHYANIHRGLYEYSQQTTAEYEAVRGKVARFIGAETDNEIIFTRNTTEGINLVAQSWARTFLKPGDEIILTEMEHHANIVPWQLLRDQIGIEIKVIAVNDDGSLDLDQFERLLTEKTKLLSMVHISNALGTVNDVKKITAMAKDFYPDMKVLIDGSQAVVHQPVNVADIGCDFYVFTGHKLYAPSCGILWGRYDVLQTMPPYQGGGDMIERVMFEKTTFKDAPARFEAGTPAIVDVIGLGAAIDYINDIGMDNIVREENNLRDYAIGALEDIDGLRFYGTTKDKAGIMSFTCSWGHPSDIGMILDQCGVAVRTGHHCCQPLMDRFDIDATVRASLGLYSNQNDINALVDAIEKTKVMLG